MFCSNCGKENADNAKFCSYCGHIFAENDMPDPMTEGYQTPEQQTGTVQPDWQSSGSEQTDGYTQPAGYARTQEMDSELDPHKVRPQTSYPSSEDHPIRPEDTIRESNRRYGKRILICAVVAFAALLVLVVFFIARPDLKKDEKPEPVQTTQETAPETAAQPETTAAPAQPAAQSEQTETTAAAQEPETTAETKQPETTVDTKQTETKAEEDDAQIQELPEGDDQTA